MNRIEELLRNAMRSHADQIRPGLPSWETVRDRAPQRQPRVHTVLVAFVAVVALGAVAGVRVLVDEDGELSISRPPLGSPTQQATSPSPSQSPSPTAAAAPTTEPGTNEKTFTTPDGVWTVKFPKDWFIEAEGEREWFLTNFGRPGAGEGGPLDKGEFKITLWIQENTEDWSLDELLNFYCEGAGDPELTVIDCRKVEYNGKLWAWALAHDEIYGGNTDFLAGHIAEGNLYQAAGIVPDGTGEQSGKAKVQAIFRSFVIAPQ